MTDSDLTTDVDVLVVGAGQAGLAAGMALRQAGLGFMIVDAAGQPGGSWPRYYDSLTLFSPARFSTLPGRRLPGRSSRHPSRDDMTRYLRDYATHFQLPVRTGARVLDTSWDGEAFEVRLSTGALDRAGWPIHCRGLSLTVSRLAYVGLPGETGVASATVRGVAADARRVIRHLRRAIHCEVPQPSRCLIPSAAARQLAEVRVVR